MELSRLLCKSIQRATYRNHSAVSWLCHWPLFVDGSKLYLFPRLEIMMLAFAMSNCYLIGLLHVSAWQGDCLPASCTPSKGFQTAAK